MLAQPEGPGPFASLGRQSERGTSVVRPELAGEVRPGAELDVDEPVIDGQVDRPANEGDSLDVASVHVEEGRLGNEGVGDGRNEAQPLGLDERPLHQL